MCPDSFEEQLDQRDFVNQGKYSMGLPWYPIHLNHLLILHVSNFDNHKDFLVIVDMLLDSYGLIAHEYIASALTKHDLYNG
jgi:hypothetical protein